MKIRKAFSLLSSLVILISMMGILPVAANATAAPFVAVGPKAVRAQAVTSPQSPLYTCQLGLRSRSYLLRSVPDSDMPIMSTRF